MSTEDEVRKASEQFYAALNRMANGDARSLADIWSQGAGVTTMHPIGGREVGWDKVRASFAQVAEMAPRRFVWNATVTMTAGRSCARWACGQVA
jgi:hypothetical protein